MPDTVRDLFKAYSPGLSVSSWAIRFAASHEQVRIVLSGMSNMQQLLDNMGYMADFQPLDKAGMDMLQKAAELINQNIAIPCTACSYCTEECPQKIAIPQYFSLYNADMQERESKDFTSQSLYYANLGLAFGKASDCIKCGKCEKHCPQHLPIRELLEKAAARFEG